MSIKKTFHEAFTKFFEEPTRDKLRELLKNNVGELDNLDFKESFPAKDKLASAWKKSKKRPQFKTITS